jgi:hypothetical protein
MVERAGNPDLSPISIAQKLVTAPSRAEVVCSNLRHGAANFAEY